MTSPFSDDRFERDQNHLYYLPTNVFTPLERPKPTFLIGARGTGKTTLLKALNWRERTSNETLLRQLEGDHFRGQFIGTYLRLPRIQLQSFESWLLQTESDQYGQVVGFYLELVFLEMISGAVSDLLANGIINVSPTIEAESVVGWSNDIPEFQSFVSADTPSTVSAFQNVVVRVRRSLERLAQIREDISIVFSQLPIRQIGDVVASVSPKIAELCNHDLKGRDGKWHFKVCVDEAECLTPFQQLVVNTLIRLAEWPLFPVVSYVSRPNDMTSTLLPNLTLQKADRQLIVIDTMEPPDFVALAEGVASVRCQEALKDPDVAFNARRTLGRLDINGLLQTIIEHSESPVKQSLLDNAHAFSAKLEATPDRLPIWEAYLADRLKLTGDPTQGREQKRHEASQEYRKKFVGAFLSICHDLKVRHVPYASADMVFGISDNCVRDFLSQLDHLYRRSGCELADFLKTEVKIDLQIRALRDASEEKRDSIPESGVMAPVETGRVVKGLAIVTSLIQSTSKDDRHLRSTERGLFRFTVRPDVEDQLPDALRLVSDAADAGFLRLYEEGDNIRHFRVHASLAPAFGFSYRNAYYVVPLPLSDFNRLKTAKTDEEIAAVARAIAKAMPGGEDHPLFASEEKTDGD